MFHFKCQWRDNKHSEFKEEQMRVVSFIICWWNMILLVCVGEQVIAWYFWVQYWQHVWRTCQNESWCNSRL